MMDFEPLQLQTRCTSGLEQELPGFKASFGGEELHRALAALTNDVVGAQFDFSNDITPSTAQLSTLSQARSLSRQASADSHSAAQAASQKQPLNALSLQLKDLQAAAKMYADAAAKAGSTPSAYDLRYSQGLVLQELASKTDPASLEHRAYLEQACTAYEAATLTRASAPAALYNWAVALSDLARVLKGAASIAAAAAGASQPSPAAPISASPSKGTGKAQAGGALQPSGTAPGNAAATAGLKGVQDAGAGPVATGRASGAGAGAESAVNLMAAAKQCLAAASDKYRAALQVQPSNTQALNNWGLVLQEASAEAETIAERDRLVHYALDKFRCAVRMRPDFDRGCYNMGTVCYSYACTLQAELASQYRGITVSALDAEGQALWQAREGDVRTAFANAAQYICLAFALSPGRDVYRRSRSLVRAMLALPFLRTGYLLAPTPAPASGSLTQEVWRRDWFVLDHTSLRATSGLEGALSTTSSAAAALGRPAAGSAGAAASPSRSPSVGQRPPPPATAAATAAAEAVASTTGALGPGATTRVSNPGEAQSLLTVMLADVAAVRRCSDLTLPPGHGIWVQLHSNPLGLYLVAEDEEAADVWSDCLLLASHIAQARGAEALAEALSPGQ